MKLENIRHEGHSVLHLILQPHFSSKYRLRRRDIFSGVNARILKPHYSEVARWLIITHDNRRGFHLPLLNILVVNIEYCVVGTRCCTRSKDRTGDPGNLDPWMPLETEGSGGL